MYDVKRILWIDDVAENEANSIFPSNETKIVTTMDAALDEIASDRLYEYDTIVLDIDFTNGLRDAEKVMRRLRNKIYLSEDQSTNSFVIENGGYLLYLFLLEQGYPSERVAFLTGNKGMIDQLKEYTMRNSAVLTIDDIIKAFIREYNPEDEDAFFDAVESMNISNHYKDSEFTNDCADKLAEKDYAGLRKLVESVDIPDKRYIIKNTGDIMIDRFHKANLESPVYFSKKSHSIYGHNREDASRWLQTRRSRDNIARWLFLSACKFVDNEFNMNETTMKAEIKNLYFENIGNTDAGIRSAFSQAFYVLSGLRNESNSKIYFQATSAMLVPFEAKLRFPLRNLNPGDKNVDYSLRKCLGFCAKEARNYCFHNYFGTSISYTLALLILMIEVSVILTPAQRRKMVSWYELQEETLVKSFTCQSKRDPLSPNDKVHKVINDLIAKGDIDFSQLKVTPYDFSSLNGYSCIDLIYALGNNNKMRKNSIVSSETKEAYYGFTLAACLVNHLNKFSQQDIQKNFGSEIFCLYKVAIAIVDDYVYPY